jgi:hypothetical protein
MGGALAVCPGVSATHATVESCAAWIGPDDRDAGITGVVLTKPLHNP